ncbi:MAG: hypothetical protein ACOC7N_03520 [Chloroflexota bacterium]
MREERDDRLDQLLDLLAEEVAERLRGSSSLAGQPLERGALIDETAEPPEEKMPSAPSEPEPVPEPPLAAEEPVEPEPEELQERPGLEAPPSTPAPRHTARLLGRLALGLLALVVLINIPINRHGTTLATAMPDTRAMVIRDGLVVKEEDDPEIYVYQDGRFRWISSLTAFEMRGYTWTDVHVVEDGFLDPFEIGPAIHVLLKCPDSPHIYRLEAEEKRWIVDIDAFEDEGHVWEDVQSVPCSYLRDLPDGETIPSGHGPPPQP